MKVTVLGAGLVGGAIARDLALDIFKHTIKILAKFKIPRIIEFVPPPIGIV